MNLYQIITPFPKMVDAVVSESILGRAASKELVEYRIHDLFDFADPPHYRIDDYPFGGGSGMVMLASPLVKAYQHCLDHLPEHRNTRVIFPTPDGKVLDHEMAMDLSKSEHLIFMNGHYKGIDQRVRDNLVTDEISIGDYVLTGGELPTLVILDSIIRLIPGVINTYESAQTDSHSNGLLDWPHYTRPEKFQDLGIPDVLLSGHHKNIAQWRLEQQELKTRNRRPDLWKKYIAKKKKEKEIGGKNG